MSGVDPHSNPGALLGQWTAPIHPSLIRPILWMGVERKVLGLNLFLSIVLLVTLDFTLTGFVVTAAAAGALHAVGLWLARQDPRLLEKYFRSRYYADYYPARAIHRASAPRVRHKAPWR